MIKRKPETERRAVLGKTREFADALANWITTGIELLTAEDRDMPIVFPLPRDASEWLQLRRTMRDLSARCTSELSDLESLPDVKSL